MEEHENEDVGWENRGREKESGDMNIHKLIRHKRQLPENDEEML